MINTNLQKYKYKKIITILSSLVILIIVSYLSIFKGIADITLKRVLGTFFSIFNFNVIELNSTEKIIFLDLRLARTLLAAVTGFSLAICGVIMQAITENKMSSPFTTGISSAASMGAAFSILF